MKHTLYFNNISGDKNLTIYQKVFWLSICILNYFYSLFLNIDKRCVVRDFRKFKFVKSKDKKLSPSRYLSDNFWNSLNWSKIHKELGKKIDILEVGCGTGKYGFFLKNKIGVFFNSYLGVDIKKRKEWKSNKKIKFKIGNSDQVNKFLKKKNIIITQSAIEHFKNDTVFFKKIYSYIKKDKKKIIQIHLIPSYSCLFTYFFHGYRHYNIKNISQITKIFKKNCSFEIFQLGSLFLNFFHLYKITLPELFKIGKDKRKDKNYSKELYIEMLKYKKSSNKIFFPSFYAIVIFHNFSKKINIV